MKTTLEMIKGVEGWCIVLANRRICGPKPWGGGKVIARWFVEVDQIYKALEEFKKPLAKSQEGVK